MFFIYAFSELPRYLGLTEYFTNEYKPKAYKNAYKPKAYKNAYKIFFSQNIFYFHFRFKNSYFCHNQDTTSIYF